MIQHFRRILLLALLLMFAASGAVADALNLLLIGVDTAEETAAETSDAMFLLRVDPENAQIRMVSFLRDLYVNVPGEGMHRLNEAYALGSETLLKQTLLENFGVAVDSTVMVHLALLAETADQLGGIELDITEEKRLELNAMLTEWDVPVEKPGMQVVNGQQALCYTKIHQIDDDFQRSERQREVISAMAHRAAEQNSWKLMKLAVQMLAEVQTDLTLGDVMGLLPVITKLDSMDTQSACVPFEEAYTEQSVDGLTVLMPDLEWNRNELNVFLDCVI